MLLQWGEKENLFHFILSPEEEKNVSRCLISTLFLLDNDTQRREKKFFFLTGSFSPSFGENKCLFFAFCLFN
jgi:hypothetical protein